MELKAWEGSPHFPFVVHRSGVIARVVAERRITSHAKDINAGGKEMVEIVLVSICLDILEKATARYRKG